MIYFKWPSGSVESNSFNVIPPGAVPISRAEHDAFIAALPAVNKVQAEFAAAVTNDDKIDVIAKYVGLK